MSDPGYWESVWPGVWSAGNWSASFPGWLDEWARSFVSLPWEFVYVWGEGGGRWEERPPMPSFDLGAPARWGVVDTGYGFGLMWVWQPGAGGKAEVSIFAWPELPELFEAAAAAAPLTDYGGGEKDATGLGRQDYWAYSGNLTWGLVAVEYSGPEASVRAWLPYPLLPVKGGYADRALDAVWAEGALGPALDLMIRAMWGGEDPPAGWLAGFLADAVGPYAYREDASGCSGITCACGLDKMTLGEAWMNCNHGLVCVGWARVVAGAAAAAGLPAAYVIGSAPEGEHAITVLVVPSSAGLEEGEAPVPSSPMPFDVDGDGLTDTAYVIADTAKMSAEEVKEYLADGGYYLIPPWGTPTITSNPVFFFPAGNEAGSVRASWPEALRSPSPGWERAWERIYAVFPELRSSLILVYANDTASTGHYTPIIFMPLTSPERDIGKTWGEYEWRAAAANATWAYPYFWLLYWGLPVGYAGVGPSFRDYVNYKCPWCDGRFVAAAEAVLGDELENRNRETPRYPLVAHVVPGPGTAARIFAALAGEPEFVPPPPPARPNLELPPPEEWVPPLLRWLADLLPWDGAAQADFENDYCWYFPAGSRPPEHVRAEGNGFTEEARLKSEFENNGLIWHEKIEVRGG